jgi:hypothetical protein
MTTPWVVAFSVFAALTLLNSVLLVALARYIGALVTRLPEPIGLELSQGPEKGSRLDGDALPAAIWEQLPMDARHREGIELIVFLSTRCSSCLALLDDLNAFTRDHAEIRILAIISGERDAAERIRSALARVETVIDVADPAPHVATAFGVATVPFALYYRDRVLAAKAVVNSRDMLESLVTGEVRASGDELVEAFGGLGRER